LHHVIYYIISKLLKKYINYFFNNFVLLLFLVIAMESQKIHEKIFEILEPMIIECIQTLNENLKVSITNPEQQVKIVIVGGYALKKYFKFNLQTADVDARIVFTHPKKIEELINNDEAAQRLLYQYKIIAINSFMSGMNKLIEENPEVIKKIKKETGAELQKIQMSNGNEKYFFQELLKMNKEQDISACIPENFIHVDTILTDVIDFGLFNMENYCSYKLSSCSYVYKIGNDEMINSIFDLVPACNHEKMSFEYATKFSDLQPADLSLVKRWYMNRRNFENTRQTYGIVPNILGDHNINEIYKNIFIAGLGYVIWDLLYMINLSLDFLSKSRYKSKEFKNNLVILKFNRYVSKYISVIKALDNPSSAITCQSFADFVKTCVKKE